MLQSHPLHSWLAHDRNLLGHQRSLPLGQAGPSCALFILECLSCKKIGPEKVPQGKVMMLLLELKCLLVTTHYFNRRGTRRSKKGNCLVLLGPHLVIRGTQLGWPVSQVLGDIELMLNPQEPFLCLTGIGIGQKWAQIMGKWSAQKRETGG